MSQQHPLNREQAFLLQANGKVRLLTESKLHDGMVWYSRV